MTDCENCGEPITDENSNNACEECGSPGCWRCMPHDMCDYCAWHDEELGEVEYG